MTDSDAASAPRELLRIVRQHPHQLPERLVLFAVARLGEPTRAWAATARARPDADVTARCAGLVHETTVASRIDGAVAGTPFFIALVPAYVAFLWAQARMVLRVAALRGRDPAGPGMAAELLALRGVYASAEEAAEALRHLDDDSSEKRGWRERFVVWSLLVRRILVLAAFLSPANPDERPGRARQVGLIVLGTVIWLGTWVFPVSFMVVMSWGCESSTRQLGALTLEYYGANGPAGETTAESAGRLARARRHLRQRRERPHRPLVWSLVLGLSVLVPLGVIALAVSKHGHHGHWITIIAPLAGLTLVLAFSRAIARRE